MRITGGKWKGQGLASPSARPVRRARQMLSVRPSADRTREALFSILAASPDIELAGARVLDLFAGTGTLGFESLSRGAAFCLFVEQSSAVCRILRRNAESLAAQNKSRILCRDARRLGACPDLPFQLVFADPPYAHKLAEQALAAALRDGWLAPAAHIIVEEDRRADFTPPDGLTLYDRRQYGDTILIFLQCD